PVGIELLRSLVRRVDHRAPGDDGDFVALAVRTRSADRNAVALLGDFALDPAIEMLVFEVEDGIRILDRPDQEALCILGCRAAHALEPRDVRKRRLGILRMKRPPGEAAARR